MKLLFAGPSLAGELDRVAADHPDITIRGPVARGDMLLAVRDGATAIGIVDGLFGSIGSVWHKEILFALHAGVAVAGGASMGALRAAECDAFGMVGIGAVYRSYAEGRELDDAAVAQIHAPVELGSAALSEATVNVDATITALEEQGLASTAEVAALRSANRALYYADRTYPAVVAAADLRSERAKDLLAVIRKHKVDQKRLDARAVIAWLAARPDRRSDERPGWPFHETSQWRAFAAEVFSLPRSPSAH